MVDIIRLAELEHTATSMADALRLQRLFNGERKLNVNWQAPETIAEFTRESYQEYELPLRNLVNDLRGIAPSGITVAIVDRQRIMAVAFSDDE